MEISNVSSYVKLLLDISKWTNYLFVLKNSEIILEIEGFPFPIEFQDISNTLIVVFAANDLKINPPPSDLI